MDDKMIMKISFLSRCNKIKQNVNDQQKKCGILKFKYSFSTRITKKDIYKTYIL